MLTGVFPLSGRSFIIGGEKYLIAERKKQDKRKPKPAHYLIVVEPKINKHYVSSLFPDSSQAGEVYHFDIDRELYQLKVQESLVEIEKL